jgi:hypothetical protein
MHEVRAVNPPPIADRPPVKSPGDRSVPPDALAAEVKALAELLAEVVMLAGDHALFPSRWALSETIMTDTVPCSEYARPSTTEIPATSAGSPQAAQQPEP